MSHLLKQIVVQRDRILSVVGTHGRKAVFGARVDEICPVGREKTIVELCLVGDCLVAIEAVLLSHRCSVIGNASVHYEFLQAAAKLFTLRDRKLYGCFTNFDKDDCQRFLETHYTDRAFFGGANRRTNWSGLHLSMQTCCMSKEDAARNAYREILNCIVRPLLNDNEKVVDVFELSGVWAAITGPTSDAVESNGHGRTKMPDDSSFGSLELMDLNNPAILFDVVSGDAANPQVKINSRHRAFQNGHSLELLLKAWASMEEDAWDKRRQLLQDVRMDWGRAARDLIQDGNEPTA